MRILLFSLILTHLWTLPTHATDLDQHQQKGLQDTQKLLKTKSEREAFIKKNKDAKDADDKAGAIAGTEEGKEAIYDMSSELMETIAKESNGDPAKMQTLLNEAQKNPEAFYNKYFTAEQKGRLKKIAEKSEAKKPSSKPRP